MCRSIELANKIDQQLRLVPIPRANSNRWVTSVSLLPNLPNRRIMLGSSVLPPSVGGAVVAEARGL